MTRMGYPWGVIATTQDATQVWSLSQHSSTTRAEARSEPPANAPLCHRGYVAFFFFFFSARTPIRFLSPSPGRFGRRGSVGSKARFGRIPKCATTSSYRGRLSRRRYLSMRLRAATERMIRRFVIKSFLFRSMCRAMKRIRSVATAICTSGEPVSPGKRAQRAMAACTSSWFSCGWFMLARDRACFSSAGISSATSRMLHSTSPGPMSSAAGGPAKGAAVVVVVPPPPAAEDGPSSQRTELKSEMRTFHRSPGSAPPARPCGAAAPPASSSMMYFGLRLRWVMPCAWQCASACSTCRSTQRASSIATRPALSSTSSGVPTSP
mmetsp:Transcript_40235/g.127220  ORF Transcript_40235/g.127220 Transcript_40235/m.127220 type:complete len:322 (+) Transcript_40235:135-1100(+)